MAASSPASTCAQSRVSNSDNIFIAFFDISIFMIIIIILENIAKQFQNIASGLDIARTYVYRLDLVFVYMHVERRRKT